MNWAEVLQLDDRAVHVIIFICGFAVLSLVLYSLREIKKLSYSLNQTDKLAYGTAIAVQIETGVELIKESANGAGDHALNRDIHRLVIRSDAARQAYKLLRELEDNQAPTIQKP